MHSYDFSGSALDVTMLKYYNLRKFKEMFKRTNNRHGTMAISLALCLQYYQM